MHPFHLDSVSGKFAIQIEQAHSIAEILSLSEEMPKVYCDLVKEVSVAAFPPIIKETITFIRFNIDQPLNLNALAETLGVNPSHLSRTFKAAEQDGAEWKRVLQACGEQRLLAQPKRDSGDMLTQVILFIEQNYASDISITEIADRLQVTPNYLSTLFHKKTGITLIKYLTKIRLLRAKELLADPEMRVQQVAELVSYSSTRHFTKVFTSYFGYYPSEQHKKGL